jgi:hypothetical protein
MIITLQIPAPARLTPGRRRSNYYTQIAASRPAPAESALIFATPGIALAPHGTYWIRPRCR